MAYFLTMEQSSHKPVSRKGLLVEAIVLTVLAIGAVVGLSRLEATEGYALSAFMVFPLVAALIRKEDLRDFGVQLDKWKQALKETGIIILVTLVPFFAGAYVVMKLDLFNLASNYRQTEPFNAEYVGQLLIYNLLYVGLCEEFFFRGYLQTRLGKVFGGRAVVPKIGLTLSAVVTAVVFMAGHLIIRPDLETLPIVFPAVLFGLLRDRTGTLIGPIIYHAACNISMSLVRHMF